MRSVISLFSRLFARPRRHNRVILIFNRMVDAIHLKFGRSRSQSSEIELEPGPFNGVDVESQPNSLQVTALSHPIRQIKFRFPLSSVSFHSFIVPFSVLHIGYALGNPHFGSNFGTSSDHPQKPRDCAFILIVHAIPREIWVFLRTRFVLKF